MQMEFTQKLIKGQVYYLEGYTAPKIYNGLFFECLYSDKKISSHTKVKQRLGSYLDFDKSDVYKPERFQIISKTQQA